MLFDLRYSSLMLVLLCFNAGFIVKADYSKLLAVEFDLQGSIDRAVESGQKRVVLAPGIYRVKPKDRQHLVLRDLTDVEIIAQNVEMICTETTRALSISNCHNVKVSGLSIDYDPLPFTQGRIVAMADDKSWIQFEIIEGYPENLEMRIEIYDGKTGLLKRSTYYGWQPFESLGNQRYRVKKGQGYRYNKDFDTEEIGDILITNSNTAPGGAIAHAIVCDNSTGVVLSDISLFASNCFGFLENNCGGTTYLRCKIDRRPLENDIKPRGLGRLRSLNADAFHSKHAVKGPSLLDCAARFQGDDCVNICGDYHMVMASESTKLRVLAKHSLNIEPGDALEIVTYEGVRMPDTKAVSTRKTGLITDDDLSFLEKQRMNEFFKRGGSREIYEVVVDRPVDLPRGSVICSANRIGSGFKIAGCDFGYNRSRGILIKASHGTVSENRIVGCWEEAIKVSPEYWWLEAGSSDDVKITDNTIEDCRGMGIAVYAHAGSGQIAPAGAHNKISVTGNSIRNARGTDIWVTSTQGLILSGNRFEGAKPEVKLEQCSNVRTDVSAELTDTEVE